MHHFWGITFLLLLVSARPTAAAHHELPDLLSLSHTQMNPAHLKTTYALAKKVCSTEEPSVLADMQTAPFYTTYTNGQATRAGVVARSQTGETYVCFRGSRNLNDARTDAHFFPKRLQDNLPNNWGEGAKAHRGIWNWYQRILQTQPLDLVGKTPETFGAPLGGPSDSSPILQTLIQALGSVGADPTNDTLIVTGFSLGGGVAPFFAQDATSVFSKVRLVPVAAPAVLNKQAVRQLEQRIGKENILRISRDWDLVTLPIPGFHHAGPKLKLPPLQHPTELIPLFAPRFFDEGLKALPDFFKAIVGMVVKNHTSEAYAARVKKIMDSWETKLKSWPILSKAIKRLDGRPQAKNRGKRPAGKRTLPDRRIPSVGRPSAFPLHTPFVAK